MEVYDFQKCLLERLEECLEVLYYNDDFIPSSKVNQEWVYYTYMEAEPAGWQALWKIPRVICNALGVRYPTVVYGTVQQVIYGELKATFVVEGVEDEDVHVPELNEVKLEDLFPTKVQENDALNVERTADCLDKLRFFYKNVWMPWDIDSDDSTNWVEAHLESRIRFCYDLRKRDMHRGLAAHIRALLTEARYVQQQREYIELELDIDNDEDLNNSSFEDKTRVTDLMRIHMRISMVRSEIEMLENAELRHVFEEIKFSADRNLKKQGLAFLALQGSTETTTKRDKGTKFSYIVMQPNSLVGQLELLESAQKYMSKDSAVQIFATLQQVLGVCEASDSIYLAPGRHDIKFLEYLNENGRICGLIDNENSDIGDAKPRDTVVLASPDDDSILLIFEGDFTLENLTIDCSMVRTGIIIKSGKVILRNCRLYGDGKSSTQMAINCAPNSNLLLENCLVEKFATGLSLQANAKCTLKASTFENCKIAVDVNSQATEISFEEANNKLVSCKTGIYAYGVTFENGADKNVILENMDNLKISMATNDEKKGSKWVGICHFQECGKNIHLMNEKYQLFQKNTLQHLMTLDGDVDYTETNGTAG